jgi:hypothetical protein
MGRQLTPAQKIARGNRQAVRSFERSARGAGRSVEHSLMRPGLGTIVTMIMAMLMCGLILMFYGAFLVLGLLLWCIVRPFERR